MCWVAREVLRQKEEEDAGGVLRWVAHDIHQASFLAGGGSRLFQGDLLLIHLNFAPHLCDQLCFSSLYDQLCF